MARHRDFHILSLQVRRRKRKFRLFVLWFAIICALLFIVAFFLNRSFFQIQSVQIVGVRLGDVETVRKNVLENLEGRYPFMVKKTNILLYPKRSVEEKILENFLEIRDVSIRYRKGTVSVNVVEREPFGIWCGNQKDFREGQCFYMDKAGLVFLAAQKGEGENFPRYFGKLSDKKDIGGKFLEAEDFSRLREFIDGFSRFSFSTTAIEHLEENDVRITGEKAAIIFTLNASPETTLSYFDIFLKNNPKLISAEKTIDLRFGNKIYFK